jgi:hypothetical protein
VPEHSAANTHLGSFRILADVELTDPDAQGVIFVQGSRFGGHAMIIRNRIGDEAVAEGPMKTLPIQFSLCGEGLRIGYDGGDAVSRQYTPTFPFTGGAIRNVTFDVADETYQDIETRLAALMARD